MSIRVLLVFALLCILGVSGLQANTVFVLPQSGTQVSLTAYNADPLNQFGTSLLLNTRPFTVIAGPNGTKYYAISRSANETVLVLDNTLKTALKSFNFGSVAESATLTPDGKRLLVAAGNLRIIDVATDTEVVPTIAFNAQNNPNGFGNNAPSDVAVSPDSRYAYVVVPNTGRIHKIDLTTLTFVGTPLYLAGAMNISLSPGGTLYVSGVNVLYAVDPVTMTQTKNLIVNGAPGRLHFSPDNTRMYTINTTPASGLPVLMQFDTTGGGLSPLSHLDFFSQNFESFTLIGPGVALVSTAQGQLYRLALENAGITPTLANFGGAPLQSVTGVVPSNEAPYPKHIFVLTQTGLRRIEVGPQLTLNPVVLQAPGGAGRMAYAAPATRGAVATIEQVNQQQTVAPGALSAPLVVRATNAQGKPVFEAPVAWSIAGVGASLEDAMAQTNIHGYATARLKTATAAAAYSVNATVDNSATATATFNVNGGTPGGGGIPGGGTPGGGATTGTVSILAGQGQLIQEQFVTLTPMRIRVLDAQGQPVPNAEVTWAVASGSLGQGGVNPINPIPGAGPKNRTDAQGYAEANYGAARVPTDRTFVTDQVTATTPFGTATFYITSYIRFYFGTNLPANPPIIRLLKPLEGPITGASGSTITDAIRVQVLGGTAPDLNRPIPNVGVVILNQGNPDTTEPPARCQGGVALTVTGDIAVPDSAGVASCNLQITGAPGEYLLRVRVGGQWDFQALRLIVTQAVPAKVTIIGAATRTGRPGDTVPALVAEIRDAQDNPLVNVDAAWQIVTPNSVILTNAQTKTDAQGRVSANAQLGNTPGTYQVRVASGNAPAATFTFTIAVPAAALEKVSGDNQNVVTGSPFNAVTVRLLDAQNQPLANQVVNFAVTGNAVLGGATATTNAQGIASMSVIAGNPGSATVTATYGNLTPAVFNLQIRQAGPQVTAAGFFNGASFQPRLSPGSIATIIGRGLAPGLNGCSLANTIIGPMPYTLANVEVTFGSARAPLYAVCNVNGQEQVNVQVPFETTPGLNNVTIKVGGGETVVQNVDVVPYAPGLFQVTNANNVPEGILVRANGSYVSPTNRPVRGEIVTLLAAGLGQPSPPTATNFVGLPDQILNTANLVIGFDNEGYSVTEASYMPGMVGIYRVSFQIPANASVGTSRKVTLGVRSGDTIVWSNDVFIPVAE